MKRIHLIIEGRVQGVFYRHNTKNKASSLDLKGYVKNLPDGKVEVVAEGPEDKLKQLITWCWQGPTLAKVKNIEEDWDDYEGEFSDFSVEY